MSIQAFAGDLQLSCSKAQESNLYDNLELNYISADDSINRDGAKLKLTLKNISVEKVIYFNHHNRYELYNDLSNNFIDISVTSALQLSLRGDILETNTGDVFNCN